MGLSLGHLGGASKGELPVPDVPDFYAHESGALYSLPKPIIQKHTRSQTSIYTYIYMYIYIYIYIYICVCDMDIGMHVCMYMYVCMYACM